MENRRCVQFAGVVFCVLLVVSEICCYPPSYSHEDYEQGIREMIEELERQGLTGPMVPRAYHPGHRMMRKSQRSSNLRLRFGKRSSPPFDVENVEPIGNPNWKVGSDVQRED